MNITMILAGIALVCVGIYREAPVANFRAFSITNGPIFAILCLLLIWAALIGGRSLAIQSGRVSLQVGGLYAPMLFMLIPIMGLGVVIAGYYQGFILELLHGKFGYLGSLGAAFASPTSVALSKFVESVWTNKAIRPQLLYLLTATPLVSWNILLIRQMGLGWEIALVMYRTNWIVAIGLMIPFWIWSRFFH
jgi:hypothetical protein